MNTLAVGLSGKSLRLMMTWTQIHSASRFTWMMDGNRAVFIDFLSPAGLCFRRSEIHTSNQHEPGDKEHLIAENRRRPTGKFTAKKAHHYFYNNRYYYSLVPTHHRDLEASPDWCIITTCAWGRWVSCHAQFDLASPFVMIWLRSFLLFHQWGR